MVHKSKKKEPAWKQSLRKVADNPDWIYNYLDAIRKELNKDDPSISYMKEKVRKLDEWIDEIDKFHWKRKGK